MMQETTDIVITTCERLPLLKRTLAHIWERTTSPYQLHVIDDASTEGNAAFVARLYAEGKLASVLLRKKRAGIPANMRDMLSLTVSDPLVFTDDDVLCPKLDPDWLAQGLIEMSTRPELGILALNSPQANVRYNMRGAHYTDEPVTYCRNVPGQFVFIRRKVLAKCYPPEKPVLGRGPIHTMCRQAAKHGWQVGYLTYVYSQHIGTVSARNNKRMDHQLAKVLPIDDETLAPPEPYQK